MKAAVTSPASSPALNSLLMNLYNALAFAHQFILLDASSEDASETVRNAFGRTHEGKAERWMTDLFNVIGKRYYCVVTKLR
ncbi:MAG: hypothetical protein M0R66_03870 [Candidatus Omnitrophica bacterium]|nr:hypothetical protein [Candidatus Omnitrophota bacterium]